LNPFVWVKLASSTEPNVTLESRTVLPGFDFGRAGNRPATGLMVSALVTYLGANDVGTGLPIRSGTCLIPRNASAQAKLDL
jgi:hypothetical protein